MVGILLLTHAPLGQAFKKVLSHIFLGQPELFDVLDVEMDDAPEAVLSKAKKMIKRLDHGAGVLVLTDVTGSTPANCAVQLKNAFPHMEIVAGISMPMLLRAVTYRDQALKAVSLAAVNGAKDGAVLIESHVKESL